jgi:hypothetical protein
LSHLGSKRSVMVSAFRFRSYGLCYVLITIVLAMAVSMSRAATTPTNVVLFAPWSHGVLRGDLVVSAKVKGSCWIHSLESERPDAWRCMAGNDIYDPCFSGSSDVKKVACAEDPFSKRLTLITLTKALPTSGQEMKLAGELAGLRLRGEPWGIRLVNGDTCEFMTGATDVVHGMRLNYACGRTGWIIGDPDRSSATWKASVIASLHDTRVKHVGIAESIF